MYHYQCSTPSRICLFGEHQDYLGLEVISMAVNLRFTARIGLRQDGQVFLRIRDEADGALESHDCHHIEMSFDLKQPIVYQQNRDYLRSVFSVLLRLGYPVGCGFDITMDSEIPIGKGMCSSSTMVIVLIKAVLTAIGHPDAENPDQIARLGFLCEVTEFGEPGGMMDHYSSALGELVHLSFGEETRAERLPFHIPGSFVLVDSLTRKNTTQVLAASKIPVLEAMEQLRVDGVQSIYDFLDAPEKLSLLYRLDDLHQRKVMANIDNLRLLRAGLSMLHEGKFQPKAFGELLALHHRYLRDGLGISTPLIEKLMKVCLEQGALGGKINGSGGGGCFFVYCASEDAPKIVTAMNIEGYPAKILTQDAGCRTDCILEETL